MTLALTHIAAFIAGSVLTAVVAGVAAAVTSHRVRQRQTDADDVRPLVPAAPNSIEDAVRRAGV